MGSKTVGPLPIRSHSNNQPLWWIHPQHGNKVDVVALPVAAPANAEMYPINGMSSDSLLLQIGMDVYILGYPYGLGMVGLPVWKRASIATEPDLVGARPAGYSTGHGLACFFDLGNHRRAKAGRLNDPLKAEAGREPAA